MHLVFYEHITSGAFTEQPLPDSLAFEGELMLRAVLADLAKLDNITVHILRDQRLDTLPAYPFLKITWIQSQADYYQAWSTYLKMNAVFLVIAPESGNILYQKCHDITQAQRDYLGCSLSAIQHCSDKYLTYQTLQKHHLPTITTQTLDDWLSSPLADIQIPVVIKPRDGAGCINTFVFDNMADLHQFTQSMPIAESHQWLIQPFINGQTLSMTLFLTADNVDILSINQQHIKRTDNMLWLEKVDIYADASIGFDKTLVTNLAQQIHRSIDGLWGLVGVDFLMTENDLTLVEINPRLTDAYAELSIKTSINGVKKMLDAYQYSHTFGARLS